MKPPPSIRSRRRHFAPLEAQRGVLLLEVLISLLIFSLALLGLVALQARAVQYSVDAEDRNRASLLVNEIVTAMWLKQSTNTGDLASEISAWEAKLSDPSQGGLPGGAQKITTNNKVILGLGPKPDGSVTIQVTWDAHNRSDPSQDSPTSKHNFTTTVVIPPAKLP
ncbi:MAG: hypothetical protein FWC58_10835 [Desulfobulbus sp.]|nr:hypothetical protein [Desulfobulbus sp.]